MNKKILVAGGAGFLGSTFSSMFNDNQITPVIIDDLSAGRLEFINSNPFYKGNIGSKELVNNIFRDHPEIDTAVLSAASILVHESMENPLKYYENNINNSIVFLESLKQNNCKNIIFSSSGSIYKSSKNFLVTENSEMEPKSPYANTKFIMEKILQNLAELNFFNVISLRYFNPIGSDPKFRSGLQIEYPSHALGKIIYSDQNNKNFTITGKNWPTRDGTGIRDYIHVWDLAKAHYLAYEKLISDEFINLKYEAINLGSGVGTTVLELVNSYEKVVNRKIKLDFAGPRPGDVAGAYANNDKALEFLGWKPEKTIINGIEDTLSWFEKRKTVLNF